MAEFFAGGHLRYLNGAWRDDNGDPVDVVKRERGEWVASGPLLECQSCGEIYSRLGGNAGKAWNFCPNCGSDNRPEGGAEG